MPRRKIAVAPPTAESVHPPEAGKDPLVLTPPALVAEHQQLTAHLKAEAKRFSEFMAPYNARKLEIENQLHAFLNENKLDSLKTDVGTAYKIHSTTPKIVDRTKYLDWCLDQWDEIGNELLQIGAPQVTAFKGYMEKRKTEIEAFIQVHNGLLPDDTSLYPPGTDASFFESIGVRKS